MTVWCHSPWEYYISTCYCSGSIPIILRQKCAILSDNIIFPHWLIKAVYGATCHGIMPFSKRILFPTSFTDATCTASCYILILLESDKTTSIGNGSSIYLVRTEGLSRIEPKGKVCIRKYNKKNATKYKIYYRGSTECNLCNQGNTPSNLC